MKFTGRTGEYFEIVELHEGNMHLFAEQQADALSVLWFQEDGNELNIDTQNHTFQKDEIICLTQFNKVSIHKLKAAKLLRFNRPFYCILHQDSEVGCKGILFYGSRNFPFLQPDKKDLYKLNAVWEVALIELDSKDNLQLEMLQMMLKRILILLTRIYKTQANFSEVESPQIDLIRDFNFLVDQHFREKHAVADYAALLNKSPKTLSNTFRKTHDKTPLQLIQDRIMLEVKRLLRYTEMPISEIGYEVGFRDVQSFSRFFKKNEGTSPSDFRQNG